MGLKPVSGGDAPTVSRGKAGKHVLRHWSRQVVPDEPLVLEKLGSDDGTHRMEAEILWPCGARPVPVETGQRIDTALLEVPAKDVSIGHSVTSNAGVSQS